MLMKQSFLTSL